MTTNPLTPADLTKAELTEANILITIYLEIRERMEADKAQLEAIKERLLAISPTSMAYEAGKVQVSYPRRVNWRNVEAAYPVEKYPHLYKQVIDQTAVKSALAPSALDVFKQDASTASVTIK